MGEVFMIPDQDESDVFVRMAKFLNDEEKEFFFSLSIEKRLSLFEQCYMKVLATIREESIKIENLEPLDTKVYKKIKDVVANLIRQNEGQKPIKTDKEIIELAEKTRKEKYCKKYIYKERGKQYCYLDCVFSDGNYGCRPQEYHTSFLDGFKAAMEYISRSNRTII